MTTDRVARDARLRCVTCGARFASKAGNRPCSKPSPGREYVDCGKGNHMFAAPVRWPPFRMAVARVSPILVQVMHDYGLDREAALSLILSHGKTCGLSFSAAGWPYDCVAVATRQTSLRQLVDFTLPLGFRLVCRRAPSNQ